MFVALQSNEKFPEEGFDVDVQSKLAEYSHFIFQFNKIFLLLSCGLRQQLAVCLNTIVFLRTWAFVRILISWSLDAYNIFFKRCQRMIVSTCLFSRVTVKLIYVN